MSAFDEMSGSPPVSVRQQAMRGLAKIALERGDRRLGKAQYERILGKALIGRGPPAEHWAHSEYAWLVFEDGDLAVSPPASSRLFLYWSPIHVVCGGAVLRSSPGVCWWTAT